MNNQNISLCENCNSMTHSIKSYKEILKPKYKKINFIICGKCRKEKKNNQQIQNSMEGEQPISDVRAKSFGEDKTADINIQNKIAQIKELKQKIMNSFPDLQEFNDLMLARDNLIAEVVNKEATQTCLKDILKIIDDIFHKKIKENHPVGLVRGHTCYQIWRELKHQIQGKLKEKGR